MLIKSFFYFTVLSFSLGQLGRISFYNQLVNIYIYEIFLTFLLLFLFIKFRFAPLFTAFRKYKIFFLFLLSLFISYILGLFSFNLFQNIVSFLYLIRLTIYFLYWVYWAYLVKKQPEFAKITFSGIFLLADLVLTVSFIQYFLYPDLRNLIYLGWDPHYHRMFGVFFDTSLAAAVFGLFFLFFLIKNNYFLSLLFLLPVILAFSRGGYLSLFFSLIYFFAAKKTLQWIFLFLVIFLVLLSIVPKQFGPGVGLSRTFSIEARLTDYQQGIKMWLKSPLFGIGYNRIGYTKENINKIYPSHSASSFSSSYLIILVCGGIIGFLLFLSAFYKLLKINKKTTTVILFIAIFSFFDNILLHPYIIFLMGSMIICINLYGKLLK